MSRILGLVLSLGVTSASAQEVCSHASTITMMADYVLQERANLPALKQARFGDTAAFMAMRYGGRDVAVLDNLANGQGRPPRLLDDLRGAYDLSRDGGLAPWQAGGAQVLERFFGMLPSTRRALLLADGGVTYFDLLTQVKADEAFADRLWQFDLFGVEPAFVLSDQPVDVRRNIAQRAEDAGHLWVAGALLGDLPDRTAFDAFMVRHADAEAFANPDPVINLGISTVGALNGEKPLRPPREDDVAATISDLQMFTTMRAALIGPPSDFLNIFANQTGDMALTSLVGQTFIDAVAAGQIDVVADPEAAWLLMYRTLLDNGDVARIQQTMATFNWPSQSIRFYAGYAIESIDVMVAVDALGPFMRGETDRVADEPAIYSGTGDWQDWTTVAERTRAGSYSDFTPEDLVMAVELLWEAELYTDAAAVAAGHMDRDAALAFMRDAIGRLDSKCGDYVGVPGEAIRYGGMAVYRFD